MTLLTAVNCVKRYSHRGDPNTTTDTITSDIVSCIMDARRDVIADLPKKWLKKSAVVPITTTVALRPAVYALATDVQDLIQLWYVEGTTIYHIHRCQSDHEWFQRIYNYASAAQRPYWFREVGLSAGGLKQVEFFPIEVTSRSVEYEYYKTVATDMTVSDLATEVPDIPTQNQDALWKGGLYYYLKAFDDPAMVVAKADYDESLLKVNKQDQADLSADVSFGWGIQPLEPRGTNGMRIF